MQLYLINRIHTRTELEQTYMCECNGRGTLYFDASSAVVFSISDNFCLVLHWSTLLCLNRCAPRLSFLLPVVVANPLFAPSLASPARFTRRSCRGAASSVFRRRFGGNNARAVSQYRAIIYFRIRRAGCMGRGKAKRETITQCCRSAMLGGFCRCGYWR